MRSNSKERKGKTWLKRRANTWQPSGDERRAKITRLTLPRYEGVDEHVNAAAGPKVPPRTRAAIIDDAIAGDATIRERTPDRSLYLGRSTRGFAIVIVIASLHLRWDQKPDHPFDPDRRSWSRSGPRSFLARGERSPGEISPIISFFLLLSPPFRPFFLLYFVTFFPTNFYFFPIIFLPFIVYFLEKEEFCPIISFFSSFPSFLCFIFR